MPATERRDEGSEDHCERPGGFEGTVGGPGAARRYQMTQRMVSIGNDFWIEDERGESVFKVDGSALRERQTLLFCNAQGLPLCQIQECMVPVQDSVEIKDPNAQLLGTVRKALISPIRERWTISLRNELDLEVKGNILDHEYCIAREHSRVAKISRQWFRLLDSYGVEINAGQDDILILAATVAIDLMAHPQR